MNGALDVELCVVSAAIGWKAAEDAVDLVADADFADPRCRAIMASIRQLVADGSAVDPLTVADRLGREGRLDAVGGLDFLAGLTDFVPSAENLDAYARSVRDAARSRRLQAALRAAIGTCQGPDGADAALDQIDRALIDLSDGPARRAPVSAGEAVERARAAMAKAATEGDTALGLGVGLREFDREIRYGPGHLAIIGGRPSHGKSAFGGRATRVAAEQAGPVLVVSLEVSAEDFALRAIAEQARLNLHAVRTGKLSHDQRAAARVAADAFAALPIQIDDTGVATPGSIRSQARRMARTCGLAMVVVDYLQLMTGGGEANRNLEVAAISRSLKSMAVELQVPVLALSQLSRAVESRSDRRPMLSDLRDSGSLEQDADSVVFVYRPEVYLTPAKAREAGVAGEADLIIAKQRNGPTGVVEVGFVKESVRFYSKVDGPR